MIRGTFAVLLFTGRLLIYILPLGAEENAELKATQYIEKNNIILHIPTFLGNATRRYYGRGPVPHKLRIHWKKNLGGGYTRIKGKDEFWRGTGWTGQPVLVEEKRGNNLNGTLYLLIGAYNYQLYKLNANTGETVWQHTYNDVIKGTPTLYVNNNSTETSFSQDGIVFCGSRNPFCYPDKERDGKGNYRAVSLLTGEDLWDYTFPRTRSYSQDVDGSGLIADDTLYLGAENGFLYVIAPATSVLSGINRYPKILNKLKLYSKQDITNHRGNLVIESSPALLKNTVYVTAGAGHVYGIDISSLTINWDFYIGSDLDATPVVTKDGFLLVGIEKQYIPGEAGVFKLNPNKTGHAAVDWYLPVPSVPFADWEGGVIGSVSINDEYDTENKLPPLCAFCSLDGNLYVLSQNETIPGQRVNGPNLDATYPTPRIVTKKRIGASISTPLFLDRYIIVGGYSGKLTVFGLDFTLSTTPQDDTFIGRDGFKYKIKVSEIASIDLQASIESTPIVWENKIYIGTRDGTFYCLGE